jgi:hypothetical protein
MKTMDERAEEYINLVQLNPNSYKGDVETAYVCGCIDQKRIDDASDTRDAVIEKLLESDNSWSTIDVLKKLIEATEILLHEKNYDGHGWEEISHCVKRGKEILLNLTSLQSESKEGKQKPSADKLIWPVYLNDKASKHQNKYASFCAFVENESIVDVWDLVCQAGEEFASLQAGKDDGKSELREELILKSFIEFLQRTYKEFGKPSWSMAGDEAYRFFVPDDEDIDEYLSQR